MLPIIWCLFEKPIARAEAGDEWTFEQHSQPRRATMRFDFDDPDLMDHLTIGQVVKAQAEMETS